MKLNSISCLVFLPMLTLGLPSPSRAQGCLVNLYTWSNATINVPSPQVYLPITSSNSCEFIGGLTFTSGDPYPVFVNPVLTTLLTTVPGTTYQISFTMEQLTPIAFSTRGTFSFGSFSDDLSAAISSDFYYATSGYGEVIYPTNFDFTGVATSTSTAMSFSLIPDSAGAVALSNFNIEAVPETSAGSLLALGGMAFLSTKTGRRFVQCAIRCHFPRQAAQIAIPPCTVGSISSRPNSCRPLQSETGIQRSAHSIEV